MSYKDNIRRTQVELAVAAQMQCPWPVHVKATRMKFIMKLQAYSTRAGNCIFDERATPAVMGTNVGYAGEKLKQKMRKAKSFHLARKSPKLSRTFHHAFSFSLFTGHRLVTTDKMVPATPLAPTNIERSSRVLILKNHKKGSLTFFNHENNPIVTIPYVCDDTLSTENVVAAWNNLTIASAAGTPRPYFRAPRQFAPAQSAQDTEK